MLHSKSIFVFITFFRVLNSSSSSHGFIFRYQVNKNGLKIASTFCTSPGFDTFGVYGSILHSSTKQTSYVSDTTDIDDFNEHTKSVGTVSFLVSEKASERKSKFGSLSPYGHPSIYDAVQHLAKKLHFFSNGTITTEIVKTSEVKNLARKSNLMEVDALIAIGLSEESDLAFASSVFEQRLARPKRIRHRQCQFNLDSPAELWSFVSSYNKKTISLPANFLPWTKDATARRQHDMIIELFNRWTSDDFCYAMMIFFNQFSGVPIDWVKHTIDATWEKGLTRNAQEIYNMVDKCGECMVKCLQDKQCRLCLSKLTEIDSRDQVASYRTIVSFESELLTNFSQCILTRNNIFQCNAKIPTIPKVEPIQKFRGQQVDEKVARSLLVGHLDHNSSMEGSLRSNVSWVVACGANVAYDQFPSQNQIFYPAADGRTMWYDPVFRVNTLDGRSVWCKRHYKVRPQKNVATFRFTVSDNGVISQEVWTIVDAADDLSWIVFHYAGAAKAVGLQYLGSLLCTPDGSMPSVNDLPQIWNLFRSAGVEPWDLYQVDNRIDTPDAIKAGVPPLSYFRKLEKL